ncbi:MAG: hypothetical protein B6I23_01860 [Rickettsiaceae bacterium 4572_127]|nr:MAG: hypothetical protein B6I23_01860 [Rickettsiaceae bacterium 4572_127]
MFGNSVSSFANRDRSDRRDRNRLESRHEKTERKSNQEARRGRSNSGRSGGSARSALVVATKNESPKVEKAVVEEETELKIAPIKKTTQYPNYSSDLQDIISNASSQYSKVGRDVKRYSKSPSSCIADFTECVSQTSICDKEMKKCLNSDKLELEKTTWFCQKKFLDKCHPDSHETMYERFLSDLAGFIEARRQRKLAGEEQARQIALAKQRAYDKKEIYKLACKNAGGLPTDNGKCGFMVSLVYPGGNVEQILTRKDKLFCNATTMGYDPIEKKVTEQTKKRNTITAIGAGVGLVGGAIAGHEIEDNMEEREEDFIADMNEENKVFADDKERKYFFGEDITKEEKETYKTKEKYIKKCGEERMSKGKCRRLADEFFTEKADEYTPRDSVDGEEEKNEEFKRCLTYGITFADCESHIKDIEISYDDFVSKFERKFRDKIKKINKEIAKKNRKKNRSEGNKVDNFKVSSSDLNEFIESLDDQKVFETWSNADRDIPDECFAEDEDGEWTFEEDACKEDLD